MPRPILLPAAGHRQSLTPPRVDGGRHPFLSGVAAPNHGTLAGSPGQPEGSGRGHHHHADFVAQSAIAGCVAARVVPSSGLESSGRSHDNALDSMFTEQEVSHVSAPSMLPIQSSGSRSHGNDAIRTLGDGPLRSASRLPIVSSAQGGTGAGWLIGAAFAPRVQLTGDCAHVINDRRGQMQTVPATEQTQGHAEAVEDMFDAYYADKVIDLAEARDLRAAIRRTVRSADRANLSRAIGVCVIRGGFGGQRYQRLMKDWEDITDEPLDAA